jgi:hypothetical protein
MAWRQQGVCQGRHPSPTAQNWMTTKALCTKTNTLPSTLLEKHQHSHKNQLKALFFNDFNRWHNPC